MYLDSIKLFAKNEKELETYLQVVGIFSQDIGMEFGIEKYTILIMKGEGIEQPNKKIRMLVEKETYKYSEILEMDTISEDEKKKKRKMKKEENEKITRNQTIQLKSHHRDKHPGCLPG